MSPVGSCEAFFTHVRGGRSSKRAFGAGRFKWRSMISKVCSKSAAVAAGSSNSSEAIRASLRAVSGNV